MSIPMSSSMRISSIRATGVDDRSVADHALNVWVEDPGWDEVQDDLRVVEYDGVTGVGSTLVSGHDVDLFRE